METDLIYADGSVYNMKAAAVAIIDNSSILKAFHDKTSTFSTCSIFQPLIGLRHQMTMKRNL